MTTTGSTNDEYKKMQNPLFLTFSDASMEVSFFDQMLRPRGRKLIKKLFLYSPVFMGGGFFTLFIIQATPTVTVFGGSLAVILSLYVGTRRITLSKYYELYWSLLMIAMGFVQIVAVEETGWIFFF